MGELSLQQIADYNNRAAFTRTRTENLRTARTFLDSVNLENTREVKTSNLSDSYSLLAGLSNRMQMIRSNLTTMLGYAQAGASASSQTDRDEYIGLLRSLSGGIDDIVDQTLWKQQRTLDGRNLDISLSANGSGASQSIQLNSFYSSDEAGFDLTSQPATGKASVYYDYYSAYRNQQAGVVGLDITEAVASEVASTRNELDSGLYRLEISYAGPDSTVSLKNFAGGLINKVEGVDLSGTGQELVDLEVGVTLSIEKEQILQSIDKYDYETEGPAELYALLDYERVFRHELAQDGFTHFTERDLDVNYKKRLTDSGTGSIEIESLVMSGIKPDKIGLASGSYSLRVNYRGEDSSVEIRDSRGRLQYLNHKVDLSGNEKVKIDTGKGVSFTIDNDSFSGNSGQMVALFTYEEEGNNNDRFDFSAYARKIEAAIEGLDADLETIAAAQDQILQINSYQNSSAYAQSAASSTAGLVTGLLSGSIGGSASSIFNSTSASSQLNLAASEIFQGTSAAMSVQAEISAVRAAKVFNA